MVCRLVPAALRRCAAAAVILAAVLPAASARALTLEPGVILIPRAPPVGPQRAALMGFDYTDLSMHAPLTSLDAPRPMFVSPVVGDGALANALPQANAAAAQAMQAVIVTYATTADRTAGVAQASVDPGVRFVFAGDEQSTFKVYPPQPMSDSALALWYTKLHCDNYSPADPADRRVEVDGQRVLVFVHPSGDICGVPPPGRYHQLLNLPPLAAGNYSLVLLHEGDDPDDPADAIGTLDFAVAQGVVTSPPLFVPGPGAAALLLLAGLLGITAWRRRDALRR